MKTMLNVVARVSNRVFVGLPLCEYAETESHTQYRSRIYDPNPCICIHTGRNQKYLDIAIAFTIDIVKDRTIINIFPDFMKT